MGRFGLQKRCPYKRNPVYSIYFGSDKRIDLLVYGVEQIVMERKFLYFFIRSFLIT